MTWMVHINTRNKWAVRKHGATRARRVLPTKTIAITYAKKLLRKGDMLAIMDRDGRVDRWVQWEER